MRSCTDVLCDWDDWGDDDDDFWLQHPLHGSGLGQQRAFVRRRSRRLLDRAHARSL
jgi:hypothetical protein